MGSTGCRRWIGGEGGIRTHGTRKGTPHFECGAFDHSATSPFYGGRARARKLAAKAPLRKPALLARALLKWADGKFLRRRGNQDPPQAFFRRSLRRFAPDGDGEGMVAAGRDNRAGIGRRRAGVHRDPAGRYSRSLYERKRILSLVRDSKSFKSPPPVIVAELWLNTVRVVLKSLPMFIGKERKKKALCLPNPPKNERPAIFHLRKYGIFVEIRESVAIRPRHFLTLDVI